MKQQHHPRARETAKVVCGRVSELIAAGEPPNAVYRALEELYERYRVQGDAVGRDAMTEVLDWFEAELQSHTV